MKADRNPALVCLVMLSLVAVVALPAASAWPSLDHLSDLDVTRGLPVDEDGDETHSFRDARSLGSGDKYNGHLDKVGDRADYFSVTAAQHQVINVHVYVKGHDGTSEWVRPTATTPPSPPSTGAASTMLVCYIYHTAEAPYPLDGAYNYFYVRDYVVNICAPVPGTHTYLVNISIDWSWTPNNFTWDYLLELDVGSVTIITDDQVVVEEMDLATRDTLWYKVQAPKGNEINGSFEILNFETTDPEERNVDVWLFPDDIGGYPRSLAWDWSAAPNEPVEPFSILATYEGWYFIKLRGMNHDSNLPCSIRLEVHVTLVPEFPAGGIQNTYFDKKRHDTDWYSFDMQANQPDPVKPGLWNDVMYFNMTERADTEDLPDFDLYLFGLLPGSRQVDLLDSSFRNDHPDFLDINRDPNKNTEHVRAAALYNGTYYLEVNAFNNSGYYDLRSEVYDRALSDDDNLPETATKIRSGVYEGHIHQAFDHYDWYKIEAKDRFRVQFDSFKGTDLFNVSFHRYDATKEEYVYITGGWNLVFNLTSREDEMTNLIDVTLGLGDFGLGAGTYYISVLAAVATQMAYDQASQRVFVYTTDSDAKADYELRIWNEKYGHTHPRYNKPIPDTIVDEDTSLIDHLDLDQHFDTNDVGKELRYKATVISGKLEQLIINDNMLGFQAAKDFNGRVVVKVTAIDERYLQTSLTWNITFTPVNDAPISMVTDPPVTFAIPEDTVRNINLNQLVMDVDEGDALSTTFDLPEGLSIDVDPDTLLANVSGDPNWFGECIVPMTFTDMAGASVSIPVSFVIENVADPPVLLEEMGTIVMEEDSSLAIELYLFIGDPDGDPLAVSLSTDQYITSSYDPSNGVLTVTPVADWSGGRGLLITATDPDGHSLQVDLWLEVVPIDDAPVITSWTPIGTDVSLLEGTTVTFVALEVLDPDSSVLFYYWYLDGTFMGPSLAYSYHPDLLDQGYHEITVRVEDETGLHDEVTWSVLVEDVPYPPEGGIATPPDKSSYSEGETVRFVAIYQDPDGDEISYSWFINGERVSTDPAFHSTMEPGDHKVTLQIVAGEDTVTEELDVTIVAASDATPWGVVAAVLIIAIASAMAIAIILTRRGR
ncbi:MAG: hypothetical protein GQ558_00855 [Thermoplasmata archaeon]|nr:hypothetical protein [Thermoplasmata archaeon]